MLLDKPEIMLLFLKKEKTKSNRKREFYNEYREDLREQI